MENTNQNIVDKFLMGQMTAHEETKFLEQLEHDESLKALYQSSKLEFENMELLVEGSLRQEMNQWEKEDAVDPVHMAPRKFQIGKLILTIATLITVLLISFYVLKPKADPIIVASKFYQPDFSTVRSIEGDPFENIKHILEQRKASSYEELKEALSQIPESSNRSAEAQYYLGHLAYLKKDYGNAKIHFQNIANEVTFKDKAEWYLSLCMIAEGKKLQYNQILEKISNQNGHAFQKSAKHLMIDLDSM